jgi:phosphotransferase system  glucose/maltose/N-acetylglucosamine-specific IIC component
MVYLSLKELIKSFFDELKKALKDYAQKQEAALKARLRKMLIISITGMVLLALAISMAGTAALFFLIGSLRYLETFLPAWEAWMIMATIATAAAAALFITLFLLIKKQLASPKTEVTETKQQEPPQEIDTSQQKQEA